VPDHPTIYLTNFASRLPPHRGPGAVYTIMANPRRWEHGDGVVSVLVPRRDDLAAIRMAREESSFAGRKLTRDDAAVITYQIAYRRNIRFNGDPIGPYDHLAHGTLSAMETGGRLVPVGDGDTLCCACSRDAAAAGLCHRVWAAQMLRRAGWVVVMDGKVRA